MIKISDYRKNNESRSFVNFQNSGFTLVELLTVIAIIAILAVILVPVIGKVKHASHSSQCKSNLRQIGAALSMYANDHQYRYPIFYLSADDSESAKATYWHALLLEQEYISRSESHRIYYCPNAEHYQFAWGKTCYGLNGNFHREKVGDKYLSNFSLHKVVNPSRTVLVGDVAVNPQWGSGGSSILHPEKGSQFNTMTFRESGNTGNLLFVDGHVEAYSREDITQQMFEPYDVVNN